VVDQATKPIRWRELAREEPLVIAFAIYALTLPYARPPVFTVGSSPAVAADLVLVVLWLVALARVVTGKIKLRFGAPFFLGVAFVGAELLSLVLAHKLGGITLVKLAAFSAMVMLPWLVGHVLTTSERVAAVMTTWFVGSVGAIGIGLLGFVTFYLDRHGLGEGLMCGWGALAPQKFPRLCSPFTTPNYFENYITSSVPMAFFVFRDRFSILPNARSILCWVYFLSAAFVTVFTLSAGVGGVALTAALAFVAWRRYQEQASRAVTFALVGIAGLIAAFGLATILVTVQPAGMGDVHIGSHDIKLWDGTRLSVWSTNRWRERPITGIGYGELASNVLDPRCWTPVDKMDAVTGPQEPHPMDGHSIVLNILAQAGVVGLATFLALVVALTRGVLWGRAKDVQDKTVRLQRDLVAAALVGSFVYHGIFGSFEESRYLWAMFALGVGLSRLSREPSASAR
jgi:O-antigen ligase